jgi:hypothetical protein
VFVLVAAAVGAPWRGRTGTTRRRWESAAGTVERGGGGRAPRGRVAECGAAQQIGFGRGECRGGDGIWCEEVK